MTVIRLQILYKFYWDRWIKMASSNKPSMNWNANDLNKEWKRFKQHCQFTFGWPLLDKTEKAKVNYLMTYIGDKGREVYGTFEFAPAAAEGQADGTRHASSVYAKFAELRGNPRHKHLQPMWVQTLSQHSLPTSKSVGARMHSPYG